MLSINTITSRINTLIQSNLADYDAVFYDLAVLQTKDNETYPIVNIGAREGLKVSPMDDRGLIFYHRVTGHNVEEGSGKGAANYEFHDYSMKLVCVAHRNTVAVDYDNDDKANTIMNILGSNKITGALVRVTGRPEIEKADVLRSEYSGNDRILSKVIDLYAFSINYNLKIRGIGEGCSL